MSHFFADYANDIPEEKKKQFKYQEDISDDEGPSRKDQKIQTIRLEIMQSEENFTNKTVEKALRTLLKNVKLLKEEIFVPKFFSKIKNEKKISANLKLKVNELEEKM